MESITLLKYKYQTGTYPLSYMIELVIKRNISEDQFKDITRLNYVGVTTLE